MQYFNNACDRMPTADGSFHLPSAIRKAKIYEEYVAETREELRIEKSTFYHMWAEDFWKVKIPKVNRFTKCDACDKLQKEDQNTKDPRAKGG